MSISYFLYFTLRYQYIERDIVESLISTTNRVIEEYHIFEKQTLIKVELLNNEDLSDYLKLMHKKYADIALLAITDENLSVRLSSKNDRFIKSATLFESILKDFTRENFQINKNNPYTIRYYDEKTGMKVIEQYKFYIFLGKIGRYRLLIVYPFKLSGKILMRTILEVVLIAVVILILTALVYIVMTRKRDGDSISQESMIIDLGILTGSVSNEGAGFYSDTSNVVSDTLSRYVHEQFSRINQACDTESVSLYTFHQTGKLVKTMELKGQVFLKIDSVSFDTIEIDNEVGRELQTGATLLFDDGKKMLLPLIYHGKFLGVINLECRTILRGEEIHLIKEGMAAILKNINDFLAINDVMTDIGTGLHSKIFFHLKYNEYLKSWRRKGGHFSIIFIEMFNEYVQIDDYAKNNVLKLIVPSIAVILNDEGFICRYDDRIALVLGSVNERKAASMAREIKSAMSNFRIKINEDTIIKIKPNITVTATDSATKETDIIAEAIKAKVTV